MAEVQLKDAHGNDITPKGSGTPSAMPASNVTVLSGTGLSSTNAQAAFRELNDKIENSGGGGGESATYDVAKGNYDEPCLIDDDASIYVGYHSLQGKMPLPENNENVVAIHCDDLQPSDYIGTRKINNKYNFRATYSLTLRPVTNAFLNALSDYKKLIADGNDVGFHNLFASSYFWRNLMYDVRPDGTTTFSPTLAELKTVVSGGKNIFGRPVTASTTFKDLKIGDDARIATVKITEATQDQWLIAMSYYTLYASSKSTPTGKLLDNTTSVANGLLLWWLEYWYNELIDNTLGYSTTEGSLAERFAADYEGTYPDAAHILSGDLSAYGHFTKGLFKGCHSCCNYEALDRILTIAETLSRRYWGLKSFTCMSYHGQEFAPLYWTGADGAYYNDRECNIIATGHTPVYVSLKGKKMNLFDIVKNHNIRMIKRQDPQVGNCEGEIAYYRGQRNIRGAFFNDIDFDERYQVNQYLALLATKATGASYSVDYATFMANMPEDFTEWHKYAYEHAGEEIADGIYMQNLYKTAIDCIRHCSGTGKIPVLGLDVNEPRITIEAAYELLCNYCYNHNIRICTMTEAMNIANRERNVSGNLFPNPSFSQSLLEDFGGSSTSADAYVPDGFYKIGDCNIAVTTSDGNKVLMLSSATTESSLITRIYGLPSGTYKFSAMLKGVVKIGKKMNSDRITSPSTLLTTLTENSVSQVSYEFNVPEPHRNLVDGRSYANTVCDGYEDNLAYIEISINVAVGGTTQIYNPRIDKIV